MRKSKSSLDRPPKNGWKALGCLIFTIVILVLALKWVM